LNGASKLAGAPIAKLPPAEEKLWLPRPATAGSGSQIRPQAEGGDGRGGVGTGQEKISRQAKIQCIPE